MKSKLYDYTSIILGGESDAFSTKKVHLALKMFQQRHLLAVEFVLHIIQRNRMDNPLLKSLTKSVFLFFINPQLYLKKMTSLFSKKHNSFLLKWRIFTIWFLQDYDLLLKDYDSVLIFIFLLKCDIYFLSSFFTCHFYLIF